MLTLLFLVLITSPHHAEPYLIPSLGDLKALFDIGFDIFSKLNEAHAFYSTFQTQAALEDIMTTVNSISRDVNALGNRIEKKLDRIVDTLLSRMPLVNKIDADSLELHKLITRINGLYKDFRVYAKDHTINNATLRSFALSITSHQHYDVNDILTQIHGLIVPQSAASLKESFVLLLSKETQMSILDLCDIGASPQQRLYEIYSVIALTEVRAFAMVSFAYTWRSTVEEGNFMSEISHREEQFELRLTQYLYIFQMAMKWAPRKLRRCDPIGGHERDKTFYEFERFIGNYIVQEDALTSDNNCYGSCSNGWSEPPRQYTCDGFGCQWKTSTCSGSIFACSTGHDNMQLCLLDRVPPAVWNPRRYQWFKDGKGNLYGNDAYDCTGTTRNVEWFRKHSSYACDVCICTCIEDYPLSDAYHFVSLREVVSNVDDNMVLTGLKFRRTDWVMQMQIQQGRLLPDGKIDDATVEWKEPENIRFDFTWANTWDEYAFTMVSSSPSYPSLDLRPDEGVAVLTDEKRTFYLDDLKAPLNHVITGVRFARISGNQRPIRLEIRVTEFDYRNGTLSNTDKSRWITADDMKDVLPIYKSSRAQVSQTSLLRNPLDLLKTIPDFVPNKSIRLDKTGIWQDAGQTTIPLLDAMEVTAHPASPIVGIHLFHKNAEATGGFLSFQIETVDRTEYIELPTIPELDSLESSK